MKIWSNFKYLFVFGMIFVLIGAACQLPINRNNDQNPSNTDLQATIDAMQTELAISGSGDQIKSQETVTEAPETPLTETETPTAVPVIAETLYRGFMVHANGRFISYDFNGMALGFNAATTAVNWIGENDVSVFPDQVYYSAFGENSGVYRVTQQGSQQLNFIDASSNPVSISVSPDGSMIAWSTSEWINNAPQTSLFLANIDGSNQRMIAQITAADQMDLLRVYYPVRWTEDGNLLYATGLTGIGGYLLFWGYNGMFLYDMASSSNITIIPDSERLGLCLSSISNDLSMAAIVCGDQPGVRVRQLSSGSEVSFPVLTDQRSAGSAKFSPNGSWLAYVIQRMNSEDEYGKVVVVPTDGSSAPSIISESSGSFEVNGWLDDSTIIVSHHDIVNNVETIWKLNRDGSNNTTLVDGQFLGFIR